MRTGTQKNDHGPWVCLNWPVWHGKHLFCASWTWVLQESKWPILLNLLIFSLVSLSLIGSLEIFISSILIVRKQEPSQLHPPYQFLLIPLPLLVDRPGFFDSSLVTIWVLQSPGQDRQAMMLLPLDDVTRRLSILLVILLFDTNVTSLPSNPNNTGRIGICCTRNFLY